MKTAFVLTLAITAFSMPAMAAERFLTAPTEKLKPFYQSSHNSLHKYNLLQKFSDADFALQYNRQLRSILNAPVAPSKANNQYARIGNGQCVDLVKHLTNTTHLSTASWIKGEHVASVSDTESLKGKAIARFTCGRGTKYCSNGSNGAHTAIILAAEKENGSNTVTSVWVVDQNSLPFYGLDTALKLGGSVAKRKLSIYGTGSMNLKSYHTVKY